MQSLIKQLFFEPSNVGEIDGADARAKTGSFSCGAVLQISLSIGESQRISDAKFRSAGCSHLVVALSLLTEKVKGKTTGEAASLAQSPSELFVEVLADWRADRTQCAALACQVLVSAIKNYSDAVRDEWSGDEALICTCFSVSERTIEREIKIGHLRTIAEVTKASNAGAGCQSCYPLIEDILSQHAREGDLTF
ncbi:MAG: iron-sulfur cluster assembly scaffold protein [Acidobacteriota bacterium]